jgi:probable rRNA maturation factor
MYRPAVANTSRQPACPVFDGRALAEPLSMAAACGPALDAPALARRRDRFYPSHMVRTPEISITSHQSSLRVPRKRITEAIALVARREKVRMLEVGIAVVGRAEMTELNERYARHRGVTDVLSFDLARAGEPGVRAEVIVCAEVAIEEASRRNLRPTHELLRYVIHGLLHLTGLDDRDPASAGRMHARQEQLLAELLARRRPGG